MQFKTIYLLLLLAFVVCSCQTETPKIIDFTSVDITTIYSKKDLSIRGLEILGEDSLALAYNLGFGLLKKKQDRFDDSELFFNFPAVIGDSVISNLDFRSVAATSSKLFALSIGSPAVLIAKELKQAKTSLKVIYTESHPKVFYDALAFWDNRDGIAMGDPVDGCMSILITNDGGNTWRKLPCEDLPPTILGEAAFAASDTNIKVLGNEAWLISGGMVSRVYHTRNRGASWTVKSTPLISGKPTTGAYSIDFYDEQQGFIVGGDYTDPAGNKKNKAITNDGGATWKTVSDGSGIGYKSCVQYVPNGRGERLVAVGATGISYSKNAGKDWTTLSEDGFYTIRFLNDSIAYAAGKERVAKLRFR